MALKRPLGGWIAEAGHADAAWEPAFDCRFYEIRSKECQRDRHIDLADAAPLTCGNHIDICHNTGRKLIEPAAPPRNGSDQPCARVSANGAIIVLIRGLRDNDFASFFDGGFCQGT